MILPRGCAVRRSRIFSDYSETCDDIGGPTVPNFPQDSMVLIFATEVLRDNVSDLAVHIRTHVSGKEYPVLVSPFLYQMRQK